MEFVSSIDDLYERQERELDELKDQIQELTKAAPKKGKTRDEFDRKISQMEYDLKAKHIDEVNEFEERQQSGEASGDLKSADVGSGGSEVAKISSDSKVSKDDEKAEKARLAEEEKRRKKEEEDRLIQMKRDKKNKKKEKKDAREHEKELENEILRANAGPGQRKIESDIINGILLSDENGLCIKDISADGNCLYRSVSSELERIRFRSPLSFKDLRRTAGSYLQRHSGHFAPFLELEPHSAEYSEYCEKVISSSEWGGHVELKAISNSLNIEIRVYSANPSSKVIIVSPENLEESSEENSIGGSGAGGIKPYIVLTYHLHYYTLGEHYNAVTEVRDEAAL